jgi:hypothetical protein
MTAILLALMLLASPARAETYCDGILTSNNVCIGSEGNVPPVIVRCNYMAAAAIAIRGVLASVIAIPFSIGRARNRRADRHSRSARAVR